MELETRAVANSDAARRDVLSDRVWLEAKPQSVYMAVCSRCNIRCVICPHHWTELAAHWDLVMPKGIFFRTGTELFPTARVVHLFGGGEPFLHPDWDELFDFASRWTFLPVISTNGTLLNQRRVEALVAAGTFLKVSIDGSCSETFNRIRCGADFTQVLRNVEQVVAERERQSTRGRFCLRFTTTAFDENIREAPQIVELASALGVDEVAFLHLATDRNPLAGHELHHQPRLSDDMLTRALEKGAELGVHVWIPPLFDPEGEFGERLRSVADRVPASRVAEYFSFPLGPFNTYTCRVPWIDTYIQPNGAVCPCPIISQEYALGDVSIDSFSAVWNGAGYRRFRATVNTTTPPSCCTPRGCYARGSLVNRGLLKTKEDGTVDELTSRCPGQLRAEFELLGEHAGGRRTRLRARVTNLGDTVWLAERRGQSDYGRVRMGVQAIDRSGRVLNRDVRRARLKRDVPPDEETVLKVKFKLPPGADGIRLDMVDEGITWFGSTGSRPLVVGQRLRAAGPRLRERASAQCWLALLAVLAAVALGVLLL